MLSDIVQLKNFLSISLSDTSQDNTLNALLSAADAAVKRYCKRDFEKTIYTEYPFRLNGEAVVLEQTPVLSYRLTGAVTNGLPTITGLSSTSNLLVGMPVVISFSPNRQTTQPFPNGATILSIDSSSQVTLTGNATYTLASATVIFGLSLWMDPSGSFGDGLGTDPAGPFGSTTLLYPGLDYALQRDQPDGTSKSGKVIRLASAFGLAGMGGAWGVYGSAWAGLQARGTLSGPLPPLWPKYPPGSLKVVYAAGLTSIPADLTAAVNAVAAWMFRNADTGLLQISSEGFQGYSSSVAQAGDALKSDADLGSTRQLLSRWRKVAI